MKKIKLLTLLPLLFTPFMTTGCQNIGVKRIGICQLVKHPALDAATDGFIEAVEEGLGKNRVKIDRQEASGDSASCVAIVNSFVTKNVDLIMANATPALQAAANSTLTIPILGTSITDYGTALSLKDFDGSVVGGNISGTTDLAPLDGQVDMILELVPTARKVGLLYCAAESNSLFQIDVVDGLLKGKGLDTKRISFADSNDLQSVLTANIAGLDVLYIPTDNTCADNVNIIDSVCRPAELPVICGEENLCKGCGVASLSIDYFNLGKKTGVMAVQILKEGKDISKMPIVFDDNPQKKFNPEICEALNITVPESYIAIE